MADQRNSKRPFLNERDAQFVDQTLEQTGSTYANPANQSAAALRAKAEYCRSVAGLMGEDTRARLIRLATEFLERASKLEPPKQNE